jgi:hypothetical protein
LPLRFLVAALLLLAVSGWWLLREDPEAAVRAAHEDLARIIIRSEADPDGIAVLDLRRLQGIFAPECRVAGDAGMFVGSHSPQELVAMMVAVRGSLRSVSLTVGELAIGFPDQATAVTRFSAELYADDRTGRPVTELRQVETRMQEIDGVWQFAAFHFE